MNLRSVLRTAAFSLLLPLPAAMAVSQPNALPGAHLMALGQLPVSGLDGDDSVGVAEVLALEPGDTAVTTDEPAASMTQLAQGARTAVVTTTSVAANGIPTAALRAYRAAEATMGLADPACRLSWGLLAGIGSIESDHGRFGGALVGDEGVSTPRIIGVPLDGSGPVAAIADTDDGRLDGDRRWDRAVGPLQFIPSTWSIVGTDGDGDGSRDPHDLDDAALAAAAYLCVGDLDLSTPRGQQQAVFAYNHSSEYVELVLRVANTYQSGLVDLPALAAGPLRGTGVDVTVALDRHAGNTSKDDKDRLGRAERGRHPKLAGKQERSADEHADERGPEPRARRGPKSTAGRPAPPDERRTDDQRPGNGRGERSDTNGPGSGDGREADPSRKRPKPPDPTPTTPKLQEFTGTVVTCGAEHCLDSYRLLGAEPYGDLVGQVVTVLAVLDGDALRVDHVVTAKPAASAETLG